MYIQDMINKYVQETGLARVETRDGMGGALFLDEGEFIPWADLGYNETYGFFRLSALPDVENQAEYATWTIHPLEGSDQEGELELKWVLLDADGGGCLLGERWQVAELLPVLAAFLDHGEHAEMIDDEEAIGTRYLSIAEACVLAHEYRKYPYSTPEEQDRLRRRLQRNIQRGNVPGVKRDPQGRYRIREASFRGWLLNNNSED